MSSCNPLKNPLYNKIEQFYNLTNYIYKITIICGLILYNIIKIVLFELTWHKKIVHKIRKKSCIQLNSWCLHLSFSNCWSYTFCFFLRILLYAWNSLSITPFLSLKNVQAHNIRELLGFGIRRTNLPQVDFSIEKIRSKSIFAKHIWGVWIWSQISHHYQ